MIKKSVAIIIILSLLAMNVFILIWFYRFKQQSAAYIEKNKNISESDELHTYKANFGANIESSNIQLDGVALKDSSGSVLLLKDILKDDKKQIFICRFSETNCESCVNSSIQLFSNWVDSIGKENVMYLGSYRNNKIFNRVKPLYGIQNMSVYNASALNIPAERLGYPYYFVLDSCMQISNVFVPDKATPEITNRYFKLIKKRYFENK